MLLARALASPDTETRIMRAVITALGTVSGTVTIDLGADRTVDARDPGRADPSHRRCGLCDPDGCHGVAGPGKTR